MTAWAIASCILAAALGPCAVTCLRGDAVDRLIGLQTAQTVTVLLLLALALLVGRAAFVDVALAAALLSFGSTLVFARFLERWL